MKNYLFAVLLSLCSIYISAQQNVYSEKEYVIANEAADRAVKIRTMDSGWLICAATHNVNTSVVYFTLIKLSPNDSIQWKKRYQVEGIFHDIVQCTDSGYCFSIEDGLNYKSFQVVRTDKNGNTVYNKRLDLAGHATMSASVMMARNNNHVYFAGTTVDTVNYRYNFQVFEMDEIGNVLNSNRYHSRTQYSSVVDIDTFSNGDLCLLGGWFNPQNTTIHGVIVDRVTSSGTLLWSKVIGAAATGMHAYCMEMLPGDNFYVSCVLLQPVPFGYTGGMTYLKLDGQGNVLWSYRYPDYVIQFGDIVISSGGKTNVIGGDQGHTFFLQLDTSANLIASRRYIDRYLTTIDTVAGGGFTLCGIDFNTKRIVDVVTTSTGQTCMDSNYVFTRTPISLLISGDSIAQTQPLTVTDETHAVAPPNIQVNVVCTNVGITEPEPSHQTLIVYCDNEKLSLTCSDIIDEAEILDQNGRVILQCKINSTVSEIDLKSISSGIYFIRVHCGDDIQTQKFLKAQ